MKVLNVFLFVLFVTKWRAADRFFPPPGYNKSLLSNQRSKVMIILRPLGFRFSEKVLDIAIMNTLRYIKSISLYDNVPPVAEDDIDVKHRVGILGAASGFVGTQIDC
jgi:hypothetical protein